LNEKKQQKNSKDSNNQIPKNYNHFNN
jgi:hypothetical protein